MTPMEGIKPPRATHYYPKGSDTSSGGGVMIIDDIIKVTMSQIEFEVEDLPNLGWIIIDSVGEENVYFRTKDGVRGFVKVDGHIHCGKEMLSEYGEVEG